MASDFEVTNEIRFAVVMYGGVSLAIYMNGIAQELLHLVRSTARLGWEGDEVCQFRFVENDLTGTEKVYRKLADKLTPGAGRNGVRFIVDILSGTSAGGINGIFLAKALAKGQSMAELEDLWVKEGDLGKLLNDSKSTQGVNLPKPSKQKSLLNSDRMYCKLLEAFTGMDFPNLDTGKKAKPLITPPTHPELVEELDLFVTTTDIRGRVIPLRTADRLVYERNYKWAFHFKYQRPGLDIASPSSMMPEQHRDFDLDQNPFLAFAARCTSSFPFAFEPMCFNKVEELVPSCGSYPYQVDFERWSRFFANAHKKEAGLGDPGVPDQAAALAEVKSRSFGDGGYLDNKPFGYVTDTLRKRSGTVPSRRKLLYIEPAPEHPELRNSQQLKDETTAPNAVENSLDALVTLPGYQPIREDLLRINERNRTIRKITGLIDGISVRLRQPAPGERRVTSLEAKRNMRIVDLQTEYGAAYASYLFLRAYDVTDILANLVGKALKYDREGSYFYAIRCIVRAWRKMFYERAEEVPFGERPVTPPGIAADNFGSTIAAFLLDFDLSYHIRKTRFLSSQIDFLYTLDVRARQRLQAMGLPPLDAFDLPTAPETISFRAELRRLKKPIDDHFRLLRSTSRHIEDNPLLCAQLEELKELLLAPRPAPAAGAAHKAQTEESLLNQVLGVTTPVDGQRGAFAPFLQQGDDDEYVENARKLIDNPVLVTKLNQVAETILNVAQEAITKVQQGAPPPPPRDDDAALLAYSAVLLLYDQFPEYDSALFPIVYGTDVGELDPVDITRVSPEDATTIVDELQDQVHKLKGIWLGHFGAFLDARWRRSDILWGRLDAAERLIRSLLPGNEGSDLIHEAHDAILQDFVADCEIDVAEQVANAALARFGDQ